MQYTAIRVRLIPTPEQERLLRMHAGTSRYAYNFAKTYSEAYYKEHGKAILNKDLSKYFRTQYDMLPWIADICKDVSDVAIRDYGVALQRSFQKHGDGYHTQFRSGKHTYQSFAVDARKLRFKGKVYLPKIGWLSVNQTPKRRIYRNPRVVYDGQYWHLSLAMELPDCQVELTDEILGVDVGIKTLVTTSTGVEFENINRTKRVKSLERRKKQIQRQMSRRCVNGAESQSKNYEKSKRAHLRITRKLTHIRENHLHHVSKALVTTKPKAIVIEDLQIRKLRANKRLAKQIRDAAWSKLRWYIEYKAVRLGINVVAAPREFASSQICSTCRTKFDPQKQKRTWGLDIREWTCCSCGATHDRDVNAALNLKWYYNHQV